MEPTNLLAHNGKIAVLVGDSTSLMGGLIADSLRRDHGLAIIDANGGSVLTAATTFIPDIVVLSENLEATPGRGFAVLKTLREALPQTRAIMLLDSDERDCVVEAFRCGARGVFSRDESLKRLNKCVRTVHEGQLWASDLHLEFLLEALGDSAATRLVDAQGARLLSEREEDVVRFLGKGFTNIQIANALKLTENTIKNYLFRIFNKLGVSSRVEVVIYADRNNREAASGLSLAHRLSNIP
jgi:two-component system, NarL family, nitrate/nitrite response regulator NarL